MRRETGNSAKKKQTNKQTNKQRWQLTAARQDLYVLEDLQMILSLVINDADEQFMEDVMLKEAEPFEVKEVTSVLQGLSLSCEERESSFAFKARTEGGENASKALNDSRYRYRA